MSADLWAAFGNSKEDNTSGRPSAPSGPTPVQAASGFGLISGSKGVQHVDNGSNNWETDSWSAVNNEIENAWRNLDQFDPLSSESSDNPLKSKLVGDSSGLANEEDDEFGDFEEPESYLPDGASLSQSLGSQAHDTAGKGHLEDDFGDFAEAQTGGQLPQQEELPENPHKYRGVEKSAIPLGNHTAVRRDISNQDGTLLDLNSPISVAEKPSRSKYIGHTFGATGKLASDQNPVPLLATEIDVDEEWDDLSASQSNQLKSNSSGKSDRKSLTQESNHSATKSAVQSAAPAPNLPPPSNVPPPSILMSLICNFISGMPERIRVTIVETWEEDEADVSMHIEELKTIARIVAGRKLRWKRDTILAQSMKIGMSGRQGGMKLTGIDKAEAQREDREAAELVHIWRQNIGSIRSALAEASTGKPPSLPAIAENAMVRTLKAEEGGIKAQRCCVLCGLKRDERADKVDREVWDQFGEWWTEHWGHTTCKTFWEEHEPTLRRR